MAYKDKNKKLEYDRLYRKKNRDKIAARMKEYREKNPDKIKAYNDSYRERRQEVNRAYAERNRDKLKEKCKRIHYQKRLEVIRILGGKCVGWREPCGIDDPRVLRVDHIFGDAAYQKTKSGNKLVRDILSGRLPIRLVQLLCANHHAIKTIENGDHLPVGDPNRSKNGRDRGGNSEPQLALF